MALLGAPIEELAAVGIAVSIIALQEAKLDSGAHLLIAADLPGFTFTHKDGKKGKGGVAFQVRDYLLAYEHMGHAGGGTADPNTLRIRVPLVVPPLQVRATHLSPTSLTYNAALQHFVRIDRATRVAGDAGYVRILVGDLNSPGLRVRQQGAWHRDHPAGGRRTASTERLERWLAEVNGDATRPSAVVASGTGPRWLTRFRADHRFSELDCVIMSARAAECCTSCATENGGGALAAPQ